MRRAHIISILAILFFFEGCGSGLRKWLDGIRPEPNSESYSAILRYDSTGQYDSVAKYYHGIVANKLVHIDSNGAIQWLQQLDSVSYLSNIDPNLVAFDESIDLTAGEKRKIFTNLFPEFYFSATIPLPITNYRLLRGMTLSEDKKEEDWQANEDKKFHAKSQGCILWAQIKGYWMIANTKKKVLKKIGYNDFDPVISSSGRHILFYKQDGDDYRIKVISVKELIGGM